MEYANAGGLQLNIHHLLRKMHTDLSTMRAQARRIMHERDFTLTIGGEEKRLKGRQAEWFAIGMMYGCTRLRLMVEHWEYNGNRQYEKTPDVIDFISELKKRGVD